LNEPSTTPQLARDPMSGMSDIIDDFMAASI